MESCLSLFPGARDSIFTQSSGAELPASGFWSPFFSNLDYSFNIAQKTKPHVCDETTPHPEPSKRFTVLYREKKREELDRYDEEEKRKSKGKRAIKPVMKSLSENRY